MYYRVVETRCYQYFDVKRHVIHVHGSRKPKLGYYSEQKLTIRLGLLIIKNRSEITHSVQSLSTERSSTYGRDKYCSVTASRLAPGRTQPPNQWVRGHSAQG